MTTQWDPSAVKTLLRTTSQRLGQLQERQDSRALTTRRDIATYLQHSNIGLARAKAQQLIQDETMGDLTEVLEMHVGLLLEHFQEIDQSAPTPVIVEAASSIIFCSPHIELKELHTLRDLLVKRLGPDFARSAAGNLDHYVPFRITNAVMAPPPSATHLDNYLLNIAQAFSVQWIPEPDRQDIMQVLTEALGPNGAPVVDVTMLRRLCSRGIPDEPPWIRPRIWKLFLGLTPNVKAQWGSTIQKQRESYYDLVRRLLEPLSSLPPPSNSLSSLDKALLNISRQLARLPKTLFDGLERQSEASPLGPLHEASPPDVYMQCASNLDSRLRLLRSDEPAFSSTQLSPIPEIRLHDETTTESQGTGSHGSHRFDRETSSAHISALTRLLYVHTSINPGNQSPHLPSLLVPLYSVLCQEVEGSELTHVEADAFWLFETMIGEISELEDEDGGSAWMASLGQRLAWADSELKEDLTQKGLDPSLPHYSYRWLAPLLTQTLPISSVIVIWDALFACEMRSRDSNPKLEFLVDVCTSMLLRARAVLQRLGKSGRKSPGLWAEDARNIPPPSPIRAWEVGDAFMEGMTLLQAYPIHSAGGVDRLLQTASDLSRRRTEELKAARHDNRTLGERLKVSVWKGFTNQAPSPERSPDGSDTEGGDEFLSSDGNETATSEDDTSPGLTSRLAKTVWRGITNQTAMEPPPSPITPMPTMESPPIPPSPFSPATIEESLSPKSRSLWSYAQSFKDSNAAATLSKVSTNWRSKGFLGPWGADTPGEPDVSANERESGTQRTSWSTSDDDEQRSVATPDPTYSPPPRPSFFKNPRESIMFHSRAPSSSDTSSPQSDSGGFMSKTKNIQASLTSLTRSQTPQPSKSGPRPLLLNSSNLMSTPRERPISRSMNSTPTPEHQEWKRVMRAKEFHHHRDSLSSVSSLAPSDTRGYRSSYDEGSAPRTIVPIGRRSLSPRVGQNFQLPPYVSHHGGPPSDGAISPRMFDTNSRRNSGWSRGDSVDSPPLSSPTVPMTPPIMVLPANDAVRVTEDESSPELFMPHDTPLEAPVKRLIRKKTPPHSTTPGDTSDSSVNSGVSLPARSPRVRSKRQVAKPPHLRLNDPQQKETLVVDRPPSDNADMAITPKASKFEQEETPFPRRHRQPSGEEGAEGADRPRKNSTRSRNGVETKTATKRRSAASEGDDEQSYDELLSAYSENEDKTFSLAYTQ